MPTRSRACFVLAVSVAPGENETFELFRDPVGMEILTRVSEQLRIAGFETTAPKPKKACDAAFRITFQDHLEVGVTLVAERESGVIDCTVLTNCSRPTGRRLSPQVVSSRWISVCSAVERALRTDSKVQSLRLVTRKELSEVERVQP